MSTAHSNPAICILYMVIATSIPLKKRSKAPVRVGLKIGVFEDIFNNRLRTLVRVVLKKVFLKISSKWPEIVLKKGDIFKPIWADLKNDFEDIQPSYGGTSRTGI